MSCIFFEASEWANVVLALEHPWLPGDRARLAADAATLSIVNASAYSHRYSETVEPVSSADILSAVRGIEPDMARALGTLARVRYNCAEGHHSVDGSPEATLALVSLLERAASKAWRVVA